jgi:hypothetical protein
MRTFLLNVGCFDRPPNQATTHDAFPMYVDAAESSALSSSHPKLAECIERQTGRC